MVRWDDDKVSRLTFALPLRRGFGAFSSVGSEHYLDRVGVTGSNPVCLTNKS